MPLGGPHICAALFKYWEGEGGEVNDAAVPEELKCVKAEVLKVKTPVEVCRLAAGQHQEIQQDIHRMTVADIFEFFQQASRDKMAKSGNRFLDKAEILYVGFELGLQRNADKSGNPLSLKRQVSIIFCLPRFAATISTHLRGNCCSGNTVRLPSGPAAVMKPWLPRCENATLGASMRRKSCGWPCSRSLQTSMWLTSKCSIPGCWRLRGLDISR